MAPLRFAPWPTAREIGHCSDIRSVRRDGTTRKRHCWDLSPRRCELSGLFTSSISALRVHVPFLGGAALLLGTLNSVLRRVRARLRASVLAWMRASMCMRVWKVVVRVVGSMPKSSMLSTMHLEKH